MLLWFYWSQQAESVHPIRRRESVPNRIPLLVFNQSINHNSSHFSSKAVKCWEAQPPANTAMWIHITITDYTCGLNQKESKRSKEEQTTAINQFFAAAKMFFSLLCLPQWQSKMINNSTKRWLHQVHYVCTALCSPSAAPCWSSSGSWNLLKKRPHIPSLNVFYTHQA